MSFLPTKLKAKFSSLGYFVGLILMFGSLGVMAQDIPDQPKSYDGVTAQSNQQSIFAQALTAAKRGSFSDAQYYSGLLSDPVQKKIITFVMIKGDIQSLSFIELDAARRDLWGWPMELKRQQLAEEKIGTSGITPAQTIQWFQGTPPVTIDGATALIRAYAQAGRLADAKALAKQWWRTKILSPLEQDSFDAEFGAYLDQDDHKARLICLLLNPQSGTNNAIEKLTPRVDEESRNVARAVLAMRSLAGSSESIYEQTTAAYPSNQILSFERARYLLRKGLEPLGFSHLKNLPPASLSPQAAQQHYTMRLSYFRAALKANDYQSAYYAMRAGGFENGEYKAESEFFAGWMALLKLGAPKLAKNHFESLREAGTSPITQGRANYWLGRTALALDDKAAAQSYFLKGSEFIYTFYGQLAAEQAGIKTLTLGKDPIPSDIDRERFNNRDLVKAVRMLGASGDTDLSYSMLLSLAQSVPNAEEASLVAGLSSLYDRPINTMRLIRQAMQRGLYMPSIAYPLRDMPAVPGTEAAFTLAIMRQESGFDPNARSHANARGIMQFIPSTGRAVARRLGLSYSDSRLYEPDFNMTLGHYHLKELADSFGGSYIMAMAGYNAGPSRMRTWVAQCGDPRGEAADPLSFIECMPLTETRNYMMRVSENINVYRARLNGGSAPLNAWQLATRGTPNIFGGSDAREIDEDEAGSAGTSDGLSYADYLKAEQQQEKSDLNAMTVVPPVATPVEKPVKKAVSPKSTSKSTKPKKSDKKSKAKSESKSKKSSKAKQQPAKKPVKKAQGQG